MSEERVKVKPDSTETLIFVVGVVLLFVGLWSITPAAAMIVFGAAGVVIGVGAYHFRRIDSEVDGGTK